MAYIKFIRDTHLGECPGRIFSEGKILQVEQAELDRLVGSGAAKKISKPRRRKKSTK